MRGVIGQAWNIKIPAAVEGRRIADRAGKMAATEDLGAGVHATAGGKRLGSGVVSRLVVKGLNIKGEKARIIVRAGQVGGAAEDDAVVGSGEVGIDVTVAGRDRTVQIQAGLAVGYLRRRARGKCQDEHSENSDIFAHSL